MTTSLNALILYLKMHRFIEPFVHSYMLIYNKRNVIHHVIL